jgi:hypothetical protein
MCTGSTFTGKSSFQTEPSMYSMSEVTRIEAVRLATAKYGPDKQATLTMMHNLASGYRSAGKLKLAIPLLEETFRRA